MSSSNKRFIWFKRDSTVFDIFVCGTYIPPSNSVHFKDQEIDMFDQLHSDIVKYSATCQINIIGDLNSRLGTSQETFSYISDNPDEQVSIDNIGFLQCFMNTDSNQSGKRLLGLLNESSLISLNGRKLGDTSGKLTCHQYKW